ncbi:MAG: class I adenylate-forming enzyme family protein [Pseudomonadota bacterium]
MVGEVSRDPFNLAAHVLAAGAETPGKTALSVGPGAEDWSFGALIEAVRGTATGLLSRGAAPGDIVLLRLGNTPDFPLAYLGALAAGLVPVPTAAALTERDVAGIITQLSPKLVVRDAGVACPAHPDEVTLAELRAMRRLAPAAWHFGDPERLGYIIYTSGTSGRPMAVMHAHRAILARQLMFDGWYGLRAEDRVMHAGAFNWTYTLGTGLMDPWTAGATAQIPAPGTAPGDLPALMAAGETTIFAAAPGVYRQMLGRGALPALPALRHGLSAGEKLPEPLRAAWCAATGTAVHEAFGMSECSTFISGAPGRPAAPGALGAAQAGRRVAIIGPQGPLPAGAPGVIAVHREDPGLMLGYFGAPEATAARYQGDWFLTGDQGRADVTGQITYLGRADDMMNAGGFRVSPLEIEAVLAGFEGITAVGAAEVTVKQDVRVIAAFYTAAHPLDEAALHRYAADKLARYKQPRLYVHLPALPTSSNGKLQRHALRQLYESRTP